MRLYLAGPMRGEPLHNWPTFESAARQLRAAGHDVISPTEIDEAEGFVQVIRDANGDVADVRLTDRYSFDACMQRDLEAIDTCDGIVLLPGWEHSAGALIEYRHAAGLGFHIYHDISDVPPASGDEVRIIDPRTGGVKGSKPCQLGWVAPAGLRALGEVAGYGASKYAATNFRRGYRWSLSINAAFRHLLAIAAGEDIDPESGLPHAAHLAWHGCTLVQFLEDYPELDDRFGGPSDDGGDIEAGL